MERGLNLSFLAIVRFPIAPVNIQLTDDAVPVQKLAYRVPVSLKEKFENENQIYGEARNNFKVRL